MKYELAKKLSDAGFVVPLGCDDYVSNPDGTALPCPTLSELIEACGEHFEALVRIDSPEGNIFFKACPTDEWFDAHDKSGCIVDCCGYETGDTPIEAVAKLWLSINNK